MQQMQSRSSARPDIGEESPLAQDTADLARRALLVLAAGAFAVGTDAFVIAGILPAVAHGVGVSVSWAGALMTGFALTYAVAAPVLSVTFGRLPRRGLLVAVLTGFAIANALAAVAPSFALLMAARVVAALAAALFTPTASALAAELAPPGRRGRALAAIAIGLTVAQVVGVPLGSLAGSLLGWRASFVAVAILGAAAAIGTRAALPFAGPSGSASPLGDRIRLAGSRPVWPVLAQTTAATTAGFAVLTYIAPVMHAAANLNGASISVVLAGFGAASALGSALGGPLDRPAWRPARRSGGAAHPDGQPRRPCRRHRTRQPGLHRHLGDGRLGPHPRPAASPAVGRTRAIHRAARAEQLGDLLRRHPRIHPRRPDPDVLTSRNSLDSERHRSCSSRNGHRASMAP
jgi:predicted MFS family arabinose efflux permease